MRAESFRVVELSAAATALLLSRSIPETVPPNAWPVSNGHLTDQPAITDLCAEIAVTLEHGPGFCVLRLHEQMVRENHSMRVAFWNLFARLAHPLPHSCDGELVYDVMAVPEPQPVRRYYSRSNIGGDIHTDGTYIHAEPPFYAALGCLRPAACGGESIVVDARKVYAELRTSAPDALRWLERAYHFDCDGQMGSLGTFQRPIFRAVNGSVHVQYLREYILAGHRKAGIPLHADAVASMDLLDKLLRREDVQSVRQLRTGEMLIINNHMMLHGRNSFADDGGGAGRLLIRLWGKRRDVAPRSEEKRHVGAVGAP